MTLNKFISMWALLALMLGQITLAQHSASHIDHGYSQEVVASIDVHDHEHDHDGDSEKHQCPECLLTKSLQIAFYNAPASLLIFSQSENLSPVRQFSSISTHYYNSNAPRAPPSLLI